MCEQRLVAKCTAELPSPVREGFGVGTRDNKPSQFGYPLPEGCTVTVAPCN
jgi:hypothetical protein